MRSLCDERALPDVRRRYRSFSNSPRDLWLRRSQDRRCRQHDQSLADAALKPYLFDYHRYPGIRMPPNPAKLLAWQTVGTQGQSPGTPSAPTTPRTVVRDPCFSRLSAPSSGSGDTRLSRRSPLTQSPLTQSPLTQSPLTNHFSRALGSRLSALGSRLSALGYRLSAIGYRLSAIFITSLHPSHAVFASKIQTTTTKKRRT